MYTIRFYKNNHLVNILHYADETARANDAFRAAREWHTRADSWEFGHEPKLTSSFTLHHGD